MKLNRPIGRGLETGTQLVLDSSCVARFNSPVSTRVPVSTRTFLYQLRPQLFREWIPNSMRCQHLPSSLGPFLAARTPRFSDFSRQFTVHLFRPWIPKLNALPTLAVLARTVSGCLNSAFLGLERNRSAVGKTKAPLVAGGPQQLGMESDSSFIPHSTFGSIPHSESHAPKGQPCPALPLTRIVILS